MQFLNGMILFVHLISFWQTSEVQKEVVKAQVKIALDIGKPLVIHSRDAEPDILELLGQASHTIILVVSSLFYFTSIKICLWYLNVEVDFDNIE